MTLQWKSEELINNKYEADTSVCSYTNNFNDFKSSFTSGIVLIGVCYYYIGIYLN